MSITPKKITVTLDITLGYKAVMQGSNVLVLEAFVDETYYPIALLPMEARQAALNAIVEQVQIDDYEGHFTSEIPEFAVGLTA